MKYLSLIFSILILPMIAMANLEIEAFQLFEGDKYGDFRNNIVVCLSDGSRWKVHPEDTSEIGEWKIGASISLAPRTSHYFTKREHKFRLNNKNTDKSVKAMIISYEEPLTIESASKYSYIDYRWDTVLGWDLTYHIVYVPYTAFAKDIILSNGTEWSVRENLDSFVKNAKVYVSTHENSENAKSFIIVGKEREAEWSFK